MLAQKYTKSMSGTGMCVQGSSGGGKGRQEVARGISGWGSAEQGDDWMWEGWNE